jgi:hypothetical protein
MALGSAIHKRSSCTRTPVVSVKRPNATHRRLFGEKDDTYPKRTVPTNDVPKILEEPLLWSSSFFGQEIPHVSLGVFTFSVINSQEGVKGLG